MQKYLRGKKEISKLSQSQKKKSQTWDLRGAQKKRAMLIFIYGYQFNSHVGILTLVCVCVSCKHVWGYIPWNWNYRQL